MCEWSDKETQSCQFQDKRVGDRFRQILAAVGSLPGESIPQVCQNWAETKAVYRFLSNDRVNAQNILSGHFHETSKRNKSIAWEFGLPTERNRASAFRTIQGEVNRVLLEGKQRPVIIVDEAQHLRNEVLEDLRLLTNYEMDSENRLCLLFVGLTELRRRLQMSVHESLDQRIVMRYNLPGLSRDELPDYLTHRLSGAGCELPLFEPAAVEAIYQATQSLPRKVNRLAHYALTASAIAKGKSVTAEHVQAALSETGS